MCNVKCMYFPENPQEYKEEIINGIKYRETTRKCMYCDKKITDWNKCFRNDGPLFYPTRARKRDTLNTRA